ncbi:hypothetical protein ACFLYU_04815 [Candidatus Dependentiae bacterium]
MVKKILALFLVASSISIMASRSIEFEVGDDYVKAKTWAALGKNDELFPISVRKDLKLNEFLFFSGPIPKGGYKSPNTLKEINQELIEAIEKYLGNSKYRYKIKTYIMVKCLISKALFPFRWCIGQFGKYISKFNVWLFPNRTILKNKIG